MEVRIKLAWLYLILSCVLPVGAQDPRCAQAGNSTFLDDEVWFHQFFPDVNYLKPVGNPQGHQNLTWCCIAAVIEYLRDGCVNGTNVKIDEQILNPDRQFPCGATYSEDQNGAPIVQVSYDWTTLQCPGWELSEASSATQWLQTLVGFLLPSVVFALNVPRGYKFPLKDFLFARGPVWQEIFFALVAMFSAILDTTIWLCIVFAMAGPLLISGSLEALLDYNVIKYMLKKDEQQHHGHSSKPTMPLALRARILFTILGGNLELATAWKHVMNLAQDLDGLDNPCPNPNHAVISSRDPAPEDDKHHQFRERIFSFDIEVNDAQPTMPLRDIRDMQHEIITSYSTDESAVVIDGFDPEREGSIMTSSDMNGQMVPDERNRTTSDSQPHPPFSIRVLSKDLGAYPSDMDRLAPPSRNTNRSRQGRYVNENSLISNENSHGPAKEELMHSDAIGRKYLETYKNEKRRKKTVGRIEQRLKAMLACQYSFGSTVGAPVVFYVGSFIYALIDILQAYGDNDVAHALGFGSWWMIIPHIATVSGLLLGGNNPNTLGAIIGAKEGSKLQYAFGATKPNSSTDLESEALYETALKRNRKSMVARHHDLLQPLYDKFFERVYEDSIYTPVSMWDRGRNKQMWLLILCAESWSSYDWQDKTTSEELKAEIINFLDETVVLSYFGRMCVMACTFLLLFLPCVLGFLTAYYTPQIGVSCRSLTIVVYMGCQALLLILWSLDTTEFDEYWQHGRSIIKAYRTSSNRSPGRLNDAFWSLQEIAHRDITLKTTKKASIWWQYIFHFLVFFLPFIAIFSAIGGTLMQIIGVFRSCFCKFNITEWVKHSSVMAVLSTNDQQDIVLARHNWIALGATGICFLSVTCFSGWWYQKRARYSFDELAIRLGEDIQQRCADLDEGATKDSKVTVIIAK